MKITCKEDFFSALKPNGECLEWTGIVTEKGYGRTSFNGVKWRAHRYALELEGIDTTNKVVMHSCDNPLCCNPAHLTVGTQKDNMSDCKNKGRYNPNYGSKHHRSKLDESQVMEIKHRLLLGDLSKDIARDYGVDASTIGLIKRGRTWANI